MEAYWKTLMKAGVPWGAIRPKSTQLDPVALRRAVDRVASGVDALDPRQIDALHAWLRAFRRHWPTGFRRILGSRGHKLLDQLQARPLDWNRYLKLKRIAVETLADLV